MGPLVPELISDQFNFVVALFVGFGFGFALEQAGFSSTRKLVGLFYGYDFTVLRVFFTAGVTAMLGVLVLDHFGLLDLDLVFVNPTFVWSAIVGGLIMGAGFVIGGFCPGTSVCAAAIGKIDGMLFILGSLVGILLFTEAYPALKKLYMANSMGAVRINEFFGISKELFAFALSVVAVAAFYFTGKIQTRTTGVTWPAAGPPVRMHRMLAVIPFVAVAFISITPSRHEAILASIAEHERQKKCVFKEIDADKLAFELTSNYYKWNLIDVRDPEAYAKSHLPLAVNIPLDSIFNREWRQVFNQNHKSNVFYSDDDTTHKKACLKARHIGDSRNFVLSHHAGEFRRLILAPPPPAKDASRQEMNLYRFRKRAGESLRHLQNSLKNVNETPKKKIRKIKGGCA